MNQRLINTVESIRDPACALFNSRRPGPGDQSVVTNTSHLQKVYSCVDLLISNIRAEKINDLGEVPAFLASRMQAHEQYPYEYMAPKYKKAAIEDGKLAVLCIAELLEVKAQTEEAYKALNPPKSKGWKK